MGFIVRRWNRRLLLIIVVAAFLAIHLRFPTVSAEIHQSLTAIKSFPYLYGVEGNPNASHPVTDHLALSDRPNAPQQDEVLEDRPDFLFADTGTYRLVEFYVHWCDVCKNFKAHYIQLGQRIRQLAGTNVTVEVHAVSCAPNRPLCKALAIERYPFFRVFTPGDATGVDVTHAQLNPVVILQKMGLAVDEKADEDWNPLISASATTVTSTWWGWLSVFWERWTTTSLPEGKFDHKRSKDELRNDVHLSFDYAMRQGVFVSNDPLSEEKAETLFNWLLLLQKTLPPTWTDLHALIKELIDNFLFVKRSEEYMLLTLEENPPQNTVWSMACSHGETDVGYTCGLWELFHVVTVGVVDFNRASVFAENRLATESVARMIRDYVDRFFGCEICRHHFVTDFDACALNRCERLLWNVTGEESDWIELPLWLFEMHNSVNVRLQVEKAVREHQPKPNFDDEIRATWPPFEDCPRCWQNLNLNSDIVYKYLKIEYGLRDALSSEYQQDLFPPEGNEILRSPEIKEFNWLSLLTYWTTSFVKPIDNKQLGHKRKVDEVKSAVAFAFDNMMRSGVFPVNTQLSEGRRAALKDWLVVLHETLPASWGGLRSLVTELLDNFIYVVKTKDYLVAVLNEYPPDQYECVLASSARDIDADFACGVWDMLHVVAHGVFNINREIGNAQHLSAEWVARTIKNVVDNFLVCETCEQIFSGFFESCEGGKCDRLTAQSGQEADWIQLPMWLALMHHSVKRRIMEEMVLREKRAPTLQEQLDSLWPSPTMCDRCWFEDGRLNDEVTYWYLELEYGTQAMAASGLYQEL